MAARGEATKTLSDGREITIRYGNRALDFIETKLDATIVDLAEKARSGRITIRQLRVMLLQGMQSAQVAAGEKPTYTEKDADGVIDDLTPVETLRFVFDAMGEAFTGKKPKPAEGDDQDAQKN